MGEEPIAMLRSDAREEININMPVITNKFISRWPNSIHRQLTILCCILAIALSGCVKYETGINFSSLNYGEIVQHIQVGEQLNSFSQQAVKTWIASIEARTKSADGRIEYLNAGEVNVIIPFNNARELVEKIDGYFNSTSISSQDDPSFNAHMQIQQNNFFLVVRNHLTYDIDLRSQVVKSTDPKVSIASGDLLNLNFSIQSPWGVNSPQLPNSIEGIAGTNDRQKSWKLESGKMNHLEAFFWLPNPLGIGSIVIILITTIGYYLKYRELPWRSKVKASL
jgi:Protein of unknown function (DUF3153)